MTELPTRRLGAQLTVPEVGLGCMGMSDFYGPSSDADSLAVLDRAADLGSTFSDTSDMYGNGANEALLSRWFISRGRRDEITLATKFGIVRGARGARQVCGDPACVHTGQTALAWMLARGEDVAPIPGTRRVSNLEQNVAAAGIGLSAQDLAQLDALGEQVGGPATPTCPASERDRHRRCCSHMPHTGLSQRNYLRVGCGS